MLFSIEQKGGAVALCGQILSSKSGFMVHSRQMERANHDDGSVLQVGPLERGPSFRLAIPSWMNVKKKNPSQSFSFLELTEV